jgi:hypothetical protein
MGLAAAAGLAVGLFSAGKALAKFGHDVNESNRAIAKYNGSLAAAFAKLDNARVMRDMQTATATSGTGSALAGQANELEEALQPLREIGGTMLNTTGILILNELTRMVKMLDMLSYLAGIEEIAEFLENVFGGNKKDVGDPVGEWGAKQGGLPPGLIPEPVPMPPREPRPGEGALGGPMVWLMKQWNEAQRKQREVDEQQKKRQGGQAPPIPPMN